MSNAVTKSAGSIVGSYGRYGMSGLGWWLEARTFSAPQQPTPRKHTMTTCIYIILVDTQIRGYVEPTHVMSCSTNTTFIQNIIRISLYIVHSHTFHCVSAFTYRSMALVYDNLLVWYSMVVCRKYNADAEFVEAGQQHVSGHTIDEWMVKWVSQSAEFGYRFRKR